MMSATSTIEARPQETAPSPWEAFRVQLQTLRTHCLKERAQASLAAAGYAADPVEWARSTTLELNLDEIEAALARIEGGTYGRCLYCGSPIPRRRLEIRPFARGCVPCSERA
jgi:RNA polymerase-binding transcription factor DksA